MTQDYEIKLPKLGESIVSATVVSIYKKENDYIQKDETLMEVATDKVNSEIPSPVEGTIKKILAKIDDTLLVGDVIAIVSTEDVTKEYIEKPKIEEEKDKDTNQSFFSPAVLRYAKENNLDLESLQKIEGTGEGKRVTRKDIESFIKSKGSQNFLELSPVRQAIANSMIKSLEVPHAYLLDEIDVTNVLNVINENKHKFLDKYSSKLSITSFIAKAIALAVKEYPLVNSSYRNGKILLNNNINLGLAVNVDDNVIVPNIKNIDNLNIIDISKHINNLATKAKNNDLEKSDIDDGTITLTNFGMTKVSIGLPIIKFPEACIIGVGSISKKVSVIDDKTQIRSIIMLSLAFDHRIFDGIYACKFITKIKGYLEKDYDRSF